MDDNKRFFQAWANNPETIENLRAFAVFGVCIDEDNVETFVDEVDENGNPTVWRFQNRKGIDHFRYSLVNKYCELKRDLFLDFGDPE